MRVFVSIPGVLKPRQNSVALRALRDSGFDVMTLPSDGSASAAEHLSAIRGLLRRCDGVVVFGFRQLKIERAAWRPGTLDAQGVDGRWSTPWSHIEAGMSIMADLPTLVLRELGLGEGVFDRRNWTGCVIGAEMYEGPSCAAFQEWRSAIAESRSRESLLT